MATRRYKVSVGETEFKVVDEVGAANNSDTFEFTVDLAASINDDKGGTRKPTKEEVLLALEQIENYIVSHQWPPA